MYPHFLASPKSLTRAKKVCIESALFQAPVLALLSFITTDTGFSHSLTWDTSNGVCNIVNLAPFFKTEITGVAGVNP
jgi:hypothetical protein